MSMTVRFDVESDVGRQRSNNEDMALVAGQKIRDGRISMTMPMKPDTELAAIVCDGMGGYAAGEVASEMAVSSFSGFTDSLQPGMDSSELVMAVKKWFAGANHEILIAANGSGMGCTLTGILIYDGKQYCLNCGDSRVYRLRYGHLKQLTTDHSERNRLGDMTAPSNLIYNAMGVPDAFVDIMPTKFVAGDKYLVCSDGLCDMIDDAKIQEILESPSCTARALVDAANLAGGKDNITVVILNVEG